MSQAHGASRYIPMSYFDSLADARKTLRENSLVALETQIDLLEWLHTNQSQAAYQNFMSVYGYKKIADQVQRETLGTWLRDRVRKVTTTAPTHYVSPDMCEMIRMAAEEMPPGGLSPKDLPSPSGFLLFARPMQIVSMFDDEETPHPVSVSAVAWEDGMVGHPTSGTQPGVSYWLFMNPNDAAAFTNKTVAAQWKAATGQDIPEPVNVIGTPPPGSPMAELMTEDEMRSAQGPLPIYDFSGWTYGTAWNSVTPGNNLVGLVERAGELRAVTIGEVNEDGSLNVAPVVDQARRLMLTTWKMLQEKITALDEERPPRYIRRRAERRMPEAGDIIVVRLRKETHGSLVVLNEEEGPWWNHRWLVRGHWRNQPYGPNKSLTKIIWISPYIKGPDDAPLVVKDKIFSLER